MNARKTEILPGSSLIENLPDEILLNISEFSASSAINLCRTSRSLSYFKNQFFEKPYNQALNELRQLLNHAALGKWDAAKAIWLKDPEILTLRGTIYHPNRTYEAAGQASIDIPVEINPGRYRYLNLTAWQIALANEEYEIAEDMAHYMDEKEKKKQFADIFPEGIAKYHWDFEEAKRRLQAVFDAVVEDISINENNWDVMNGATRSALYQLYAYVKPMLGHQAGLVFDASIYLEALKLYEEKFIDFKKENSWDQRSFWCIRVEEYLASLLGTGYLRPHAQGILRELKQTGCILNSNSSYFAFHRPGHSLPGFHFFVGAYGVCAERAWRSVGAVASRKIADSVSTLILNKNERKKKMCINIFPSQQIDSFKLLK